MRSFFEYLRWGMFRVAYAHVRDSLARRIAFALPRRVVMWASIRLIGHATVGKHGDTVVPDLRAMEALRRWDDE